MAPSSDALRIPLVQEDLDIAITTVESGRVQVRTITDTREAVVDQTLVKNTLTVERRTVDRKVDVAPPPRDEGDCTIISIVEERPVVATELFVVEEVVIRRVVKSHDVQTPIRLRSMRAVIDTRSPTEE